MAKSQDVETLVPQETDATGPCDSATLYEASRPFVRRWNQLVSQTNWEKGRIICQWRKALQEAGASAQQYSDDAWARAVEGVSAQHVGRLRRVYERFGTSYDQFPDLSWTHFFAACQWPDAEMWLEGAVQNGWSICQMRRMRQETLSALGKADATSEMELPIQWDEDAPIDVETDQQDQPLHEAASADDQYTAVDEVASKPQSVEEPALDGGPDPGKRKELAHTTSKQPAVNLDIPWDSLPDDLADAVDALKVLIIKHRSDGWREVPADTLVAVLDYLKRLVTSELT